MACLCTGETEAGLGMCTAGGLRAPSARSIVLSLALIVQPYLERTGEMTWRSEEKGERRV